MSALAVQTALPTATAAPMTHAAGGDAGHGFSFADALTGLDKSTKDDKSRKSDTQESFDAASTTTPATTQTQSANAANPTQALEAALAAFASSETQAQGATDSGDGSSASTGTSQSNGARVRLPLGPMALSAAAAAPASTLFSAIENAGSSAAPAVFDLTGAVPLQRQLSSDPTLGFQSLQVRTHLAAADAVPVRTQSLGTAGTTGEATTASPAVIGSARAATSTEQPALFRSVVPTSATNAADAVSATASGGQTPTSVVPAAGGPAATVDVDPRRQSRITTGARGATAAARSHGASPGAASPSQAAGNSWNGAVASASSDAYGGRRSSGNGGWATSSAATAETASNSVSDASAIESTSGTLADSASAPVSLGVSQLPEFIAEQAGELNAEAANLSPAAAATTVAKAPQAVKELDIELNPGDLGSVKLQMRLVNGKLSVVISVANPKTLASIEGEREAIASRIGGSQQELEDLTIRRQLDFTQGSGGTGSEGNSSSDSDQSNAQSGQNSGRDGNSTSDRGASGSSGSRTGAGGVSSFSDFVV